MKTWGAFFLIWVLSSWSVQAGPALVTSGEHPGFTRLVMQFDGPVDWQMGRSADGYVLRIRGESPGYDLTKVFDLINKRRLAAIWVEQSSGDLHFGIACDCYAMLFEFRPGIVVVDLRDGKPPKGSSFEKPLKGIGHVITDLRVPHQMQPLTYDWVAVTAEHLRAVSGAGFVTMMTKNSAKDFAPDPALEAFRTSLMDEMSRGASQGIVDMAKPAAVGNTSMAGTDGSVLIHLGETPNLAVRQKGEAETPLTATGTTCISDDQLDVSVWGSSRAVSDQIGPQRQGLTGEFDRPDPDAVARAIRFELFLGFGAEARGLARAFPSGLADRAVWDSMAHIMDDLPDPAPVFAGMQECNTAAALWASFGQTPVAPKSYDGKAALLRSFSALPAHLRRHLGPRLVQNFLASGDITAATSLRDAVLRAPGDPGPQIVLMQAALDRATNQSGKSESRLEPLATTGGPSSGEALVALVEQRAALGQTVGFDQVLALEGYLKDRANGVDAQKYKHALILARAASGDFDGAFDAATATPDTLWPVWQILARSGSDSALLTHAVLPAAGLPPRAAKPAAAAIADRLLVLGLADQASNWLKLADNPPLLLDARISLALGKPEDVLQKLRADDSDDALSIKAQALAALNDEKGAAEIFAKLGEPDLQNLALGRLHAWDAVAQTGTDEWKVVAAVVAPPNVRASKPETQSSEGILARNKTLVDDSTATREAINVLLSSVKVPLPPTQ